MIWSSASGWMKVPCSENFLSISVCICCSLPLKNGGVFASFGGIDFGILECCCKVVFFVLMVGIFIWLVGCGSRMLEMMVAIPAFLVGIALLYKCSDYLVVGSSKTAAYLRVSPLIISVVVVAFGTSAPEMAISVGAAVGGNAEISLGNVVGSCVANLMLVLGLAAVIRPVKIGGTVLRRELPLLVVATVLLLVFSVVGLLDEFRLLGGALFLVLFVCFVWYFVRIARREREKIEKIEVKSINRNVALIVVGIAGVVFGAYLLIESSVSIATFFGVPTFVIALSMVAIGTSLPELVVSAMAAFRGEDDIAVGNVLGSNVFNILLVLGASALFVPLGAKENILESVFLLVITLLLFPLLYRGFDVNRWEGILLLAGYGVFTYWIYFL